jgi:hypothetical protein
VVVKRVSDVVVCLECGGADLCEEAVGERSGEAGSEGQGRVGERRGGGVAEGGEGGGKARRNRALVAGAGGALEGTAEKVRPIQKVLCDLCDDAEQRPGRVLRC